MTEKITEKKTHQVWKINIRSGIVHSDVQFFSFEHFGHRILTKHVLQHLDEAFLVKQKQHKSTTHKSNKTTKPYLKMHSIYFCIRGRIFYWRFKQIRLQNSGDNRIRVHVIDGIGCPLKTIDWNKENCVGLETYFQYHNFVFKVYVNRSKGFHFLVAIYRF